MPVGSGCVPAADCERTRLGCILGSGTSACMCSDQGRSETSLYGRGQRTERTCTARSHKQCTSISSCIALRQIVAVTRRVVVVP